MKSSFILTLVLMSSVSFGQERTWSLRDCIGYAMDNNLSIERSKLNLNSTKLDARISKFDFLPDLNGSGSENFSFGKSPNPATYQYETNNRSNLSLQLSSNITVFNAGRLNNSFRLNKEQVKSSEFALKELENNIALNIANSYLQILFQKELLETAEQQLELSAQQYDRMKIRVKSGVESYSKLLEVESQFYTDQQSKQSAYFNLQNSRLTLFQLLDIQNYENQNIEIPEIDAPLPLDSLNVNQIFLLSKSTLPQYKKIEADRKISKLNTKISIANKMPTISLGAGMNTQSAYSFNSDNNIPTGDQLEDFFSQNVSISLRVPIFNKFRNNLNIQKATLNELQVDVNERELNNKVYKDIQSALFNAESAYEAYLTSEKAYNSSLESYNNANERYKLALLSIYDFQQSKNALFASKSKLIQTKYDYIFKTMVLKFYQGHPIKID